MIEQFRALASESEYHVTDYIRYMDNDDEFAGVILGVVAPGQAGTSIEPSNKVRYIVEREIPQPSSQEKMELLKRVTQEGRNGPLNFHAALEMLGNPFGFADGADEVYEGAVIGRK